MHKRSCDVQGLCDGFLQTQRCGAWVELLFLIPTFFVFWGRPKDETAMMVLWRRKKKNKYTIQLFIDTELFDTLGFIVRSYRFPVVSPLFLNADPRKKCPHHLLLHCSLCREITVWVVHRKSLFDIKNPQHIDCRNRPFLLSLRCKLKGSGSTEPHNHSLSAQAIHCTYCLTHCLFIVISGSVFVLIAVR